MRIIITLIALAFAQLFFNVAEAAPHSHATATTHKTGKKAITDENRRKRKPVKTATQTKKQNKTHKVAHVSKKTHKSSLKTVHTTKARPVVRGHKKADTSQKILAQHRIKVASPSTAAKVVSATHRQKYQKARQTAMNKLMNQIGKPYQWGGTSPHTGFDCSGLVYYAYKDLVKFKIPRTANEMYHLRDAAPVKRNALQKGDLVFFRIHRRGAADHVGVYVGNGKFIQSPSTGKDIRITDLSGDYWQRHYIGARRVMTPTTVR